jgi:hypothetical protein
LAVPADSCNQVSGLTGCFQRLFFFFLFGCCCCCRNNNSNLGGSGARCSSSSGSTSSSFFFLLSFTSVEQEAAGDVSWESKPSLSSGRVHGGLERLQRVSSQTQSLRDAFQSFQSYGRRTRATLLSTMLPVGTPPSALDYNLLSLSFLHKLALRED